MAKRARRKIKASRAEAAGGAEAPPVVGSTTSVTEVESDATTVKSPGTTIDGTSSSVADDDYRYVTPGEASPVEGESDAEPEGTESPPTCHLLRLPRELRDNIWALVLLDAVDTERPLRLTSDGEGRSDESASVPEGVVQHFKHEKYSTRTESANIVSLFRLNKQIAYETNPRDSGRCLLGPTYIPAQGFRSDFASSILPLLSYGPIRRLR